MRLKVVDIPSEGFDLTAKSAGDPWFAAILADAFREDWQREAAFLQLHILKTCENVSVTGKAEVSLHPTCARCLVSFRHPLSIPVEITLVPHREKQAKEGEEVELVEEDLNFAFYRGGTIDLADIVREFLLLAIPFRYLCSEKCRGICPKCGANRNEKQCDCRPTSTDPRFAALKNFKAVH